MTHSPFESDEEDRPDHSGPVFHPLSEDEQRLVVDGEFTVRDDPPKESEYHIPKADPTVAPIAPPPRPMGIMAVIATVLGVLALSSGVWFSVRNNWPAVIPSALVLAGVGLLIVRMVRGPVQEAEYEAALVAAEPILFPSARVERSLSPGERLYIETHEHPLSIAPWAGLALLATGVSIWLASAIQWQVGATFWGISLAFCVYRMALWERRIFCVTDRYIILIEGVFTTHENRMLIAKVTDAKKVVPLHSKVLAWLRITNLSYGTFHLETAGQEQAINKVGWLPGINQVTRITMALASGNRPDLPPDN